MRGKSRKSSTIFEVLSAVFLTTKLFSDMMVCRWVIPKFKTQCFLSKSRQLLTQ